MIRAAAADDNRNSLNKRKYATAYRCSKRVGAMGHAVGLGHTIPKLRRDAPTAFGLRSKNHYFQPTFSGGIGVR